MKHTSLKTDLEDQAGFCAELVLRLHRDIQSAELDERGHLEGRCQKQGDITRIRRELSKLFKMLEPRDEVHSV